MAVLAFAALPSSAAFALAFSFASFALSFAFASSFALSLLELRVGSCEEGFPRFFVILFILVFLGLLLVLGCVGALLLIGLIGFVLVFAVLLLFLVSTSCVVCTVVVVMARSVWPVLRPVASAEGLLSLTSVLVVWRGSRRWQKSWILPRLVL